MLISAVTNVLQYLAGVGGQALDGLGVVGNELSTLILKIAGA